jgi:hypothetical protein
VPLIPVVFNEMPLSGRGNALTGPLEAGLSLIGVLSPVGFYVKGIGLNLPRPPLMPTVKSEASRKGGFVEDLPMAGLGKDAILIEFWLFRRPS